MFGELSAIYANHAVVIARFQLFCSSLFVRFHLNFHYYGSLGITLFFHP